MSRIMPGSGTALLVITFALLLGACGGNDSDPAAVLADYEYAGSEDSGSAGQEPPLNIQPPVDATGASPTGGTPLPDFEGAVPGDDGSGPLLLGVVNDLPNEDRLDFLFEFCGWYGPDCFRDAHFMDPDNPQLGSGGWTADRPFHIRHGFINNGEEPLGEGFDVVVYVTSLDGTPSEFGGVPAGETVRYTSDYVLRGTSDQCGPTYRSQTESETCEWFVHDFPDGLPEGRSAIWAVWEAPCSAWLDMGLTESCDNPNEVTSMFSSGYDGPFGPREPSFNEANEAPQLYR